MKRKINFLMAALMLTSCFAQGVYANTVVAPASAGVIKSDRMLISVPSGEIFKLLGFDVNINGDTITIKDSDHTVVLKNGESTFTTDGKAVKPDVPQQIISDSYYIPVRAIAESVGATVEWKADTKIAVITYKGKSISVKRNLIFGADIYNAYWAKIKEAQNSRSGEYADSRYDSMCKYSIYDIDNDGVPELLIYIAEHAEGCGVSVYTFKNGEAVYCGKITGPVAFNEYNGKNEIISTIHPSEHYAYYLDGQNIVKDESFFVDDTDDSEECISSNGKINGKTASRAEFKKVFGNKIPEYPLTDASGLDVLTVFSVVSEDKPVEKVTQVAKTNESDIAEAYKKALKEAPLPTATSQEASAGLYWKKSGYSLYDIDKDGVPELIVSYQLVYGQASKSLVYTYKDGAAQSCGFIPQLVPDNPTDDGFANHSGFVFAYNSGNGIYVANDPLSHNIAVVTLNGTKLSSKGKLQERGNEESLKTYELSNLTPIENLKG
jgi:hypothetical protein